MTAEFKRRLLLPNVVPVFLLTCTVRRRLLDSEVVTGNVRAFAAPDNVTALLINGVTTGLTYTQVEATVESTPGTWLVPDATNSAPYQAYGIVINPPTGRTIFDDIYLVEFTVHFSTRPKSFRDVLWQSRIQSMPSLSFRIEEKFSGVGQVGGGRVTLSNQDGHFDTLQEADPSVSFAEPVYWSGGTAQLEMGLDLATDPGAGDMSEADYQVIGTWRIESTDLGDADFTVNLKEIKSALELEIPFETYTRAEFPGIDDAMVGAPQARAYGKHFAVAPVLLDANDRRFRMVGHAIRSFDAVKIQTYVDETTAAAVTDWAVHSGSAYRTNMAREVVNVTFDGDDLVKANSPEKVVTTQGTWCHRDSVLYVRPSTGETIDSGTYEASTVTSLPVWQTIDFETRDESLAEFTLGEEWDRSAAVAVDFSGRMTTDGLLMENAADIVEDLLTYAGADATIHAASFAASRAIFRLGVDRFGEEVTHLAPALLLKERKPLRDVIDTICETVGASFFADFDGLWRFVAFEPVQGSALDYAKDGLLRTFTEKEILGAVQKSTDAREVFSTVKVIFAPRVEQKWSQDVTIARPANQYVHNLSELDTIERKPALWKRTDATYYGQRLVTTEGEDLVKYRLSLPLCAFFLLPTERIRVRHPRYALDAVLEVLEVSYALTSGRVSVVAGNQRGWGDSFGFWVADTADDWDPAATTAEAHAARQEQGHWQDANEFADVTDQTRSYRAARWW